jgi:hypothetical protein
MTTRTPAELKERPPTDDLILAVAAETRGNYGNPLTLLTDAELLDFGGRLLERVAKENTK